MPSKDTFERARAKYVSEYGEDSADFLMEAFADQFASYDEIFYMQFHDSAQSRRACAECARFMKWKFVEIAADKTLISDALNMRIDDGRFFVLPRGKILKASYDDGIFSI